MSCENFNKIEVVESLLNVSLMPYQKQMLKIMECNKCNNMMCNDRLADGSSLDLYIQVPRMMRHDYYTQIINKTLEARKRTVSPNVMR